MRVSRKPSRKTVMLVSSSPAPCAAPPGVDRRMRGFPRIWARVVHRIGGLPRDVTPHVPRHSYASLAADLGLADATIGSLLGHAGHSITRRYIHTADAVLLEAADRLAGEIEGMLRGAHE